MNEYYLEHIYRNRSAELQHIAAMDRLAAELAPASALRRYAANHDGSSESRPWVGFLARLRRLLHTGPAGTTAGR